MPPRPCKEDEVRNPDTNRCVKKTGVVGRKLLALAQKNAAVKKQIEQKDVPVKVNAKVEKKCRSDQVLNPITKRCVSKDGKLGKQIQAGKLHIGNDDKAKQQPIIVVKPKKNLFKSVIYLEHKTTKSKVKVEVVGNVSGKHTFQVKFDEKAKKQKLTRESYVIQEIIEFALDYIAAQIDAGFVQVKAEGDNIETYEEYIKQFFVCKIENVRKTHTADVVNVSKCVNDSTIIMFEPLSSIPPEDIISLSDGYCFEVNEIAEFCISQGKFLNALTNNVLQVEDIHRLLSHKRLSKVNKDKLRAVQNALQKDADNIQSLYNQDPTLVKNILKLILYVGIVCTMDYTETFAESQTALGIMAEVFNTKLSKVHKKVLDKLYAPCWKINMEWILKNYNLQCIHGIGFRICEIALFNIFALGCQKDVIPKDLFQSGSTYDNKPFLIYLNYSPAYKDYAIYAYIHELNVSKNKVFDLIFARVGAVQKQRNGTLTFSDNLKYGIKLTGDVISFYYDELEPAVVSALLDRQEDKFTLKSKLTVIEKLAAKFT
jgi:hypothetical protein